MKDDFNPPLPPELAAKVDQHQCMRNTLDALQADPMYQDLSKKTSGYLWSFTASEYLAYRLGQLPRDKMVGSFATISSAFRAQQQQCALLEKKVIATVDQELAAYTGRPFP